MERLSFLIVEDTEADARMLTNLLSELPLLYQTDWCQTATDVMNRLRTSTYDLVFLDMRIPGLLGTDLLSNMPLRPPIVVVTAYPEYAVPCYDLQIADFLVKPFDRSRLQRSINRALTNSLAQLPRLQQESIFLQINRRNQQFHYKDILFVEAYGAYAKIHQHHGATVVSHSISWLEMQLPTSQFMRIQKSFIINLHHVTTVEAQCVWIGETRITVGIPYREQIKQFIININRDNKNGKDQSS